MDARTTVLSSTVTVARPKDSSGGGGASGARGTSEDPPWQEVSSRVSKRDRVMVAKFNNVLP